MVLKRQRSGRRHTIPNICFCVKKKLTTLDYLYNELSTFNICNKWYREIHSHPPCLIPLGHEGRHSSSSPSSHWKINHQIELL